MWASRRAPPGVLGESSLVRARTPAVNHAMPSRPVGSCCSAMTCRPWC